jgi:hypothetical protein
MDGLREVEDFTSYIFGFHKLPLYFNWFPARNREALAEGGLSLKAFAVADSCCLIGGRQCMFRRSYAEEVGAWEPHAAARAWAERHAIAAIAAAKAVRLNAMARQGLARPAGRGAAAKVAAYRPGAARLQAARPSALAAHPARNGPARDVAACFAASFAARGGAK